MKILKKYKYTITAVLIVIIIFGVIYLKRKLDSNKYQNIITEDNLLKTVDNNQETIKEENDVCQVDIKGAIKNPGVYKTDCLSNVDDVIKLAGGLNDNADTSVTNLAKKVINEMVIIIYTKEEVKNSNIVNTVVKIIDKECVCPNIQNDGCLNTELTDTIGGSEKPNLVNINTASLTKLQDIPGIGESKAKAIIKYREENGNFKTIEEIKNVDGIGSKLYEEIKTYITT